MNDTQTTDGTYRVTAGELRSFVEQYERCDAEKKDISDRQKDIMSEAKSRGYDVKTLKSIIAMRKKTPDELSEEEAVLELYRDALDM